VFFASSFASADIVLVALHLAPFDRQAILIIAKQFDDVKREAGILAMRQRRLSKK
jgi:hypothetical protein